MRLDVEAAERALVERVARPLGMDATAAAEGILRIAVTAMSYAVKGVTTERGLDAGDFALVAYGGAGPLHAVLVAREIGIRTVIIPTAPGVFSAFGMLFSDLRYDHVRTWFTRLEDAPFDRIEGVYRELEHQGRAAIDAQLGRAAQGRSQARRRHALCRTGACGDGRPAAGGVRARGPRRDQAPLRRDARAALWHVGAGGAGRDREPALDRHRHHAQAAAGKNQPRQARARARRRRQPAAAGSISTAPSARRRPMPAPRSPPATGSAARRWSRSMPRPRCCCRATRSRSMPYGNLLIRIAGGR